MAIAAILNEDEFDRSNQFRVLNPQGLVCSGKPFRKGEEFDKSLVTDRRLRQLWLARDLLMVQIDHRAPRKKHSAAPNLQQVQKEEDTNQAGFADDEANELRRQYQQITGKKGSPNWTAETYRKKIMEAELF